jgi:hypothetical protein
LNILARLEERAQAAPDDIVIIGQKNAANMIPHLAVLASSYPPMIPVVVARLCPN